MTRRASGFVIFRATVKDGKGGSATGTKSEKAASFADYVEKAETGAIGRALAALGYGTQFAPELSEEHRIVDAPVETQQEQVARQETKPAQSQRPLVKQEAQKPAPDTKQQVNNLLAEYRDLFPEQAEAKGWAAVVLRDALDIEAGEKVPTVFTPDDVDRLCLHIQAKRHGLDKAS